MTEASPDTTSQETKAPLPPGCEDCPLAHREQLGLKLDRWDYVVALAGNPNTGKSTVFNTLTGLRQHTGNWPGKTVARAEGGMAYADKRFKLIDLPGTYSLLSASFDEDVARDFVLFGRPDVTVVVVDATRLESNLNLVLQIMEITDRVVVCVNLMDEARRRGLDVDTRRLSRDLGVPVVPTAARHNEGIDALLQMIHEVATGEYTTKPLRIALDNSRVAERLPPLVERIEATFPELPNARWLALRLLDGDARVLEAIRKGEWNATTDADTTLETTTGASADKGDAEATNTAQDTAAQTEEAARREALLAYANELRWELNEQFHEQLVETIFTHAAQLADRAVTRPEGGERLGWDRTLDRIVTSKRWGIPIMILLFALVFWITIAGANVPSQWLSSLLIGTVLPWLKSGATAIGMPWWLKGFLLDGMYLATAWVISVMLPPMAIFFPLFTLLEDLGYLPRVAFNLDHLYRRAGTHGKQALSMMMGFGCNAAGVIATRVIDSPRERLIAIITNNFSLCNGRWPTQILLASLFVGVLAPPYLAGLVSAAVVFLVAGLGVALTFLVSWGLSRTVLRGEPSSFSLELPPYRPPRILQTLYTSLIDRTVFVLWRAIVFALPAGAVIWLLANVKIGGQSVAAYLVHGMDPLGVLLGLNGIILLAYIVAIPANEIVIPTILMLTVLMANIQGAGQGAGVMFEPGSQTASMAIFKAGGWTLLTAVNLMLFSLIHNPCSTTIYTIYKETGSKKWTLLATLLPLAMGFFVTFVVAQLWRLLS